MPKGFANEEVPEINPERDGYCHPRQAKRTKCICGAVLEMHSAATQCKCGRVHRKAPGSAFGPTGFQPVRPGGRKGCPGTPA